jgi:hypothetical protein
MAVSMRRVAPTADTEITPSQTLKAPISAGVHMRVSIGDTSSGKACALIAPASTIPTFFQKNARSMLI